MNEDHVTQTGAPPQGAQVAVPAAVQAPTRATSIADIPDPSPGTTTQNAYQAVPAQPVGQPTQPAQSAQPAAPLQTDATKKHPVLWIVVGAASIVLGTLFIPLVGLLLSGLTSGMTAREMKDAQEPDLGKLKVARVLGIIGFIASIATWAIVAALKITANYI